MVFSYYLYKYPYKFTWYLFKLFKKNPDVVAYCADPLDYVVLEPILKYLPRVETVVKNRKTARYLKMRRIKFKRMPCFPEAVMMCRHAAYKFPEQKIVRIGFRHGAFHFKSFANARYYNAFDLYFMTSQKEVEEAIAKGIKSARAVGFPKLDPIFNGTINAVTIEAARLKSNMDRARKTIIFTATWDKSGMSAIQKWIDHIDDFALDYNVLVTVHPWMSQIYVEKLKKEGIFFIDDPDILPYLKLADVLIGDTSSIIAEFCALDKPIVTFKVGEAKRTVPGITRLLEDISIQVESVAQLKHAIEYCLNNPGEKGEARQKANRMMFDQLDGQAGRRAAEMIKNMLFNK
jgi:CDP-glycerol glycerophosphotransferase (TagB/SpsB family)